jgi:ubiquitin-conjugating enzyme E2 J1
MSDGSNGTAGDGAPSRASPARTDATASKYNQRNPAVKRILREMREMAEDASPAFHAEAVEEDIFEWHFAILGPEDSEFEGGIYHGRVLLPPEYPFKPPSFVLLTPSGRFETNTKICLSITQHHPEHWQPSWSVRTALTAVRAFMPSPAEGAVGSLDYTKEERRKLAERSRREPPEFGASPERREVARRAHAAALRKWADRRNQSGETENLDANPVSVTRENVPATCVPASRDASDTEADTEADGNGNERASATDASSNGFEKRTTTFPATPTRSEDSDRRKTETETETETETTPRCVETPSARLPPVSAEADSTRSSGRRESDAASGTSSAAPPPLSVGAPRRRRREPDSPEVARLKQKLDVAAAFLLFAIAAILARRFLAHVASGDEF